MQGHYDHIFKILLIGDAGVGKSSILLRFTDDAFEEHLASTIGVDFKVKTVHMRGKTLKLTIWDTAGQERFRTLTSSYYRGCHGIILVFDVNDRPSFEHLRTWLDEFELYATSAAAAKLLVGNKVDLDAREVTVEEAQAFARQQATMYIETSAKTRSGILQAFDEIVQKVLDTPELLADAGGRATALPQQLDSDDGGGCGMC
ncbi:Rab18, rab family GTPase [Emiliania huxleyi CCMP1516]|uniref:Uncharacterized protein n=3 Tax=Emiliania huxleyi TaxID=2903 RepID=A0A0D3IE90_EMIH1|nr:Rab18, rab family GTPase [Emiliania huxleyi CCMP1516]EOD09575.1 Rab18, rab family GTPase [Emiliania huxleyi CCMP1516]|eukprot:XP_005762004.1 Rab18, rab family GTPase [Emiliania huxleyi CCMP1516]